MYHPYRDGYSVLPKLKRITDAEVFVPVPNYSRFIDEKWDLWRSGRHAEFYYGNLKLIGALNTLLYGELMEFFAVYHPRQHPWPKGHRPVHIAFRDVLMHIPEDIVIHRVEDDRDWMAFGHLYFPSGWDPAEKIGKSFEEIHGPVPGFKSSRKLVESMVYSGPFERFVWSAIFEDRIDSHPSNTFAPFDPDNPQVWVKVERQTIRGFPEHKAALFVLQQFLVPEAEIDKPALVAALAGMSPAEIAYKGMEQSHGPLLEYLRKG